MRKILLEYFSIKRIPTKKVDSKESNVENQPQASIYFQKTKKLQQSKSANLKASNTGLNVLNGNLLETPIIKKELSNVKRQPDEANEESEETPTKKSKWEPNNWKEQFERIKTMRANLDAPVDTMGCETLNSCDQYQPENIKRYHILVSLMLSSQTKDEVTAKAMNGLYKLPLNIDTILATEEEVIEKAIYPASFYKRKAQYIKRTSQILKDKYNSDIPDNVDDLCKLPGVGPKMAYICMSAAWKVKISSYLLRIKISKKMQFSIYRKTPYLVLCHSYFFEGSTG
jgi:endonuclease III